MIARLTLGYRVVSIPVARMYVGERRLLRTWDYEVRTNLLAFRSSFTYPYYRYYVLIEQRSLLDGWTRRRSKRRYIFDVDCVRSCADWHRQRVAVPIIIYV